MLVERRDTANVRTRAADHGRQPIVSLVADGPPGTVPDLQGMSAREAVRTLVRLGLTAQLSGDGFVMSQDPPAGAALEPGAVCRLVLTRVGRAERAGRPAMTWAELHGDCCAHRGMRIRPGRDVPVGREPSRVTGVAYDSRTRRARRTSSSR